MLQSKLKVAGLALVLITVIGWGVGESAFPQAPVPEDSVQAQAQFVQQREGRPKWEYKALARTAVEKLAPENSKNKLTDGLNVLGGDAWELVGIDQAAAPQGMPGGFGGGAGAGGFGQAPAPGAAPGGGAGAGPGGVGAQAPGGGTGFRPPVSSTYVFKRTK